MAKPSRSVRELLEYIVEVQTEVVKVLGDVDFPQLVPPASPEAIARAEARTGVKFPPAYREFFSISNGVRHFAHEIDLMSVEDLRSSEYEGLVEEIRNIGWEIGERVLVEGFIIAGQPGFRSIFLIDRTVEPDADGERPVVHWSDTELLRAANFRDFLEEWSAVADELLADSREKARETPPGIRLVRRPGSS